MRTSGEMEIKRTDGRTMDEEGATGTMEDAVAHEAATVDIGELAMTVENPVVSD